MLLYIYHNPSVCLSIYLLINQSYTRIIFLIQSSLYIFLFLPRLLAMLFLSLHLFIYSFSYPICLSIYLPVHESAKLVSVCLGHYIFRVAPPAVGLCPFLFCLSIDLPLLLFVYLVLSVLTHNTDILY